jgi:hypothetical protein
MTWCSAYVNLNSEVSPSGVDLVCTQTTGRSDVTISAYTSSYSLPRQFCAYPSTRDFHVMGWRRIRIAPNTFLHSPGELLALAWRSI